MNELIHAMPKADLHIHLDGSLRLETFLELADVHGVDLPAMSEKGLYEKVFKKKYVDLEDYLEGFSFTCAVLGDESAIERAAFELCEDCIADGVYYVEIRFAPQLLASSDLTVLDVLSAATNGIRRAEKSWDIERSSFRIMKPPFRGALITCALRFFEPRFSFLYQEYFKEKSFASPQGVFAAASLDLVKDALCARESGLPVVGVDLAGAEIGNPAKSHRAAFSLAKDAGLKITLHAGEAVGPSSIVDALDTCFAHRLGHGTSVFGDQSFLEVSKEILRGIPLVERLINQNVPLEVCLTSNMQTIPLVNDIGKHPFKAMLDVGIPVVLCTDNLLVSRTTLSREFCLAQSAWNLTEDEIFRIAHSGFEHAFFPGNFQEKEMFLKEIKLFRFTQELN